MNNKYLLDTSALWNIRNKINPAAIIEEGIKLYITQLTPFEYGNILWKSYIRGITTQTEIKNEITLLEKLIETKILEIITIKNYKQISTTSIKLKITFYDASYVTTAKTNNIPLVTDDKGLLENSKAISIKAITSKDLKKTHPEIFYKTNS